MRQALALLLDAYRELNARKLFWLTLAISATVVIGFASLSFTDKGVSILFGLWEVESPIKAGSPLARPFYIGIFSYFIVGIWLTWAAAILALVSTTSIFPDFLAGGAIDIVLSKPISRLRLFSLKYIASLLFVVLQVAVFCIGVFLCVAWRLDTWNFKIFLAVPIITAFFSYLFAVNVLVGVWTRSSLTALLLTILFWFGLFSASAAQNIVRTVQVEQQLNIEREKQAITTIDEQIDQLGDNEDSFAAARRQRLQDQRESREAKITDLQAAVDKIEPWRSGLSTGMWMLPKTSETVDLLNRALRDPTGLNIMDLIEGRGIDNGNGNNDAEVEDNPERRRQSADRVVREELQSHSLWYVLGSSLAFELVVLALAAWLFCRRDF